MRRRQDGQATVELVLVLPVVVLALLLVIQVALVARAQIVVVEAAREGARAAAVERTAAAATAAVVRTPGLPDGCARTEVSIGAGQGGIATVTVVCRVPTDVPLIGPLVGDPVVEAASSMLVEDPATTAGG